MLGICRLLIFFKINVFKKFFREHYRVSNRLDPDQTWYSVGPDLGPNCLQSYQLATLVHEGKRVKEVDDIIWKN